MIIYKYTYINIITMRRERIVVFGSGFVISLMGVALLYGFGFFIYRFGENTYTEINDFGYFGIAMVLIGIAIMLGSLFVKDRPIS